MEERRHADDPGNVNWGHPDKVPMVKVADRNA